MKTRTYQLALASAVAICILLAAALAYVLQYRGHSPPLCSLAGPGRSARAGDGLAALGRRAIPRRREADPALAAVQLSPQRLQEIGVTTAVAELKNVSDDLSVPGNVDIDEEKLSYVQTRFPGWIQDVFANATYQYVRKGQRLFTVYSPDLVSSEQEYLLAKQNEDAFSQDMHGMAAHESGWLLKAAEERLLQFGIPAQTIADLEQSGKVQRNIAVDSPASGYITEREALPNAYVQPETKLYTIADLSTVWVYANVFQNDVGRLRPGDGAQVTVDAYPGRHFNGRIDQILPEVDPATRTVRVRLVFRNPGVVLKPGMYVNVAHRGFARAATGHSGFRGAASGHASHRVYRPRKRQSGAAHHRDRAAARRFDRRPQRAEAGRSGGQLGQLPGGFRSAASGGSRSLYCPAATNRLQARIPHSTAQITIDLSTEPSPPRKGANTVRVKLTGSGWQAGDGSTGDARTSSCRPCLRWGWPRNTPLPRSPIKAMAFTKAHCNCRRAGHGM